MITYHLNPALQTINPAFKGNIKINGRFETNEIPAESPSFLKVLHMLIMMKEAHMNPTKAIQPFHDLGGKVFIPMHYGTYDLPDEPLGEPLSILENMKQSGKIDGKLKAMAIGEIFYLSE